MQKTLLFGLLLFMAGLSANAEIERGDTKESLRGLNGVYVIAQVIGEQPEGLTTNRIEMLVKSALATAGIPTDATPKKSNGDANLSVTVDTINQPQLGAYVFTVEVAVTQDVQLARSGPARGMSAETWRRTLRGITTPDRTDVIEQALKQCVNLFVANYRSVNPTK